jgi:hypothetical protein
MSQACRRFPPIITAGPWAPACRSQQVNTETLAVSLSQDGRHVMHVTIRWSHDARTGIVLSDLIDFDAEFGTFARYGCGTYDERRGVWKAADGFAIDRLTAEDRAMAAAMAHAQKSIMQRA